MLLVNQHGQQRVLSGAPYVLCRFPILLPAEPAYLLYKYCRAEIVREDTLLHIGALAVKLQATRRH
jgi:hypothetical protein